MSSVLFLSDLSMFKSHPYNYFSELKIELYKQLATSFFHIEIQNLNDELYAFKIRSTSPPPLRPQLNYNNILLYFKQIARFCHETVVDFKSSLRLAFIPITSLIYGRYIAVTQKNAHQTQWEYY